MISNFFQKLIRITLTLGDTSAKFPGTENNVLLLTAARVMCEIEGHVSFPGQANVKIFGMKQADMNALTIPWGTQAAGTGFNNTILVETNSIATPNSYSQVFLGQLIEAGPIYDAAPDVFFLVQASVLYNLQLAGSPTSSYPQNTPVSTIVGNLAAAMGLQFNNQAVDAISPPQYLAGTLMDQLRVVCNNNNIDWFINASELVICPRNAGRSDLPVLNVTPQNGLLGYPMFTRSGLMARLVFDPSILMQQQVAISGSDVPAANATWSIIGSNTRIESYEPNGVWETQLQLVQQSIQGGF